MDGSIFLFSQKYFSWLICVLEKLHLHHHERRIFVQSLSCFSKINFLYFFGEFIVQNSQLAHHQIIIRLYSIQKILN